MTHVRRALIRVALGSGNPAKRRGVEAALGRVQPGAPAEVACFDVPSGVRDQPWGDEETLRGAENRASEALGQMRASEAPFDPAAPDPAAPDTGGRGTIAIGIEGGLTRAGSTVWSFSWAVALHADGARGAARSAAFALPPRVKGLLETGLELGDAIDRVFGVHGSKRADGAVGLLTSGALDRAGLYAQVVVLALMPLLRRDLFVEGPA